MRNWGLLRELLLATGMIFILVSGLWALTGNMPPVVVVESSSMIHVEDGEVGSIDAGDLILVHSPTRKNIVTYAEATDESNTNYGLTSHGMEGDVIVYLKNGGAQTPIIHRAILKVLANDTISPNRTTSDLVCPSEYTLDVYTLDTDDGRRGTCVKTWDIPGTTIRNQEKISWDFNQYKCDLTDNGAHAKVLRIIDWEPLQEGYITLGDNNHCNIDQGRSVTNGTTGDGLRDGNGQQVKPVLDEWVEGVAGAEIPWLGAVKLMTLSISDESSPGTTYVPQSTWISLFVTILVLFMIPFIIEPLAIHFISRSPEMNSFEQEEELDQIVFGSRLIEDE